MLGWTAGTSTDFARRKETRAAGVLQRNEGKIFRADERSHLQHLSPSHELHPGQDTGVTAKVSCEMGFYLEKTAMWGFGCF